MPDFKKTNLSKTNYKKRAMKRQQQLEAMLFVPPRLPKLKRSGKGGMPAKVVDERAMERAAKLGISTNRIAALLGVSREYLYLNKYNEKIAQWRMEGAEKFREQAVEIALEKKDATLIKYFDERMLPYEEGEKSNSQDLIIAKAVQLLNIQLTQVSEPPKPLEDNIQPIETKGLLTEETSNE